MGRAILIIGAGALLAGVIIYAFIDCVRSEKWQVRTLPKPAWLAVIVLFPLVGSILWFFFGRPQDAGVLASLRKSGPVPGQAIKAPDDDEEYLRFLTAKAKRERESRERTARNQRSEQGGQSKGPAPEDNPDQGDSVQER